MAEQRRGEPKSKTKDFMYRGPMPNPTTFAETRKKWEKKEREVTRARAGKGVKMVPLKMGRKLKRKTNRGTSRTSGR